MISKRDAIDILDDMIINIDNDCPIPFGIVDRGNLTAIKNLIQSYKEN